MNAVDVRSELVKALRLDLVGPQPGGPYADEVLPQPPSRWYLTGFLVPYEAAAEDRRDAQATEEVDEGGARGGLDDTATPEKASARRAFLPSSFGMSVLVPKGARSIRVRLSWGDYASLPEEPAAPGAAGTGGQPTEEPGTRFNWRRQARQAEVVVAVGAPTGRPVPTEVPESGGLRVVTSVREVRSAFARGAELVPPGTRAVSVFVVNHRPAKTGEAKDESLVFQLEMALESEEPFVPRPNVRGLTTDDWDERVTDLQYRDACEFAVGHGVATRAHRDSDGTCRQVRTTWLPTAEVEKVEPVLFDDVELSMETLGAVAEPGALQQALEPTAVRYSEWITSQRRTAPAGGPRGDTARAVLDQAEAVCRRIRAGLALLSEPQVFEAFSMANRVMATAARRRASQVRGVAPEAVAAPQWRPFQLAFLLMNLPGTAEPAHHDRQLVDLLFFPTGGGKTEAYLGLAAFTLVLRRLRNPGITSAGVSVLMRYTLRLLTLDQLSRAATLICALELERQSNVAKLGPWPFEIGLWVGSAATPNRMGRPNDPDRNTARAKTMDFLRDDRRPSPIPLENCPWCGTRFTRNSFRLSPTPAAPTDLLVSCTNRQCDFRGDRSLPIVAVDEPLYRRLPCFLIATVDKFAALPWVGQVGALFGLVDRADTAGFYGPSDPGPGARLDGPLLPPDLIIQDELHLISGPLGTMVGLYETAIDELCTRRGPGGITRPKIVASTATVRRADTQVRALFARAGVEVFPPPGPDRRDSFFARTAPTTTIPGQLYVGVAAQGRSPKTILLRTYLPLLARAQRLLKENGGKRPRNPADAYMTLVGYFNSLRELGGSRRIVEDEIDSRVSGYGRRLRVGEQTGLFDNRRIVGQPVELTSRESTWAVADAKRRLARGFHEDDRVDVALATNMISVGLDIGRLGLMVVFGQPKTTAEYIQATSRVGRSAVGPGLVVTILNVHKPRDRSHYERFEAYHETFYRSVEATSVTPFAPRAIDRGLAAVAVGLARHGEPSLTPPTGASLVGAALPRLGFVSDVLAQRASSHDHRLGATDAEGLRQKIKARVKDLLDEWVRLADDQRRVGGTLQYQREVGSARRLLYDPLDPDLKNQPPGARKFRAQRSLRDVEPSVALWVSRLDGVSVEAEDEA